MTIKRSKIFAKTLDKKLKKISTIFETKKTFFLALYNFSYRIKKLKKALKKSS